MMSSSLPGVDDANDAESYSAANAAALALSAMGNHMVSDGAGDNYTEPPPEHYPLPTGYRIPNSSPTRAGRWTAQEHKIFLKGVATYGRTWTKVAAMVGTRTAGQVRSHAQKFDLRLAKELQAPEGHHPHHGGAAAGFPQESGTAGSSDGFGPDYHSIGGSSHGQGGGGGQADDGDQDGSEGDSGEDGRSPALKTKRGGGRPKGSTKEKGKQRKANVARGKSEAQSRTYPSHPGADAFFLNAQEQYREQQRAVESQAQQQQQQLPPKNWRSFMPPQASPMHGYGNPHVPSYPHQQPPPMSALEAALRASQAGAHPSYGAAVAGHNGINSHGNGGNSNNSGSNSGTIGSQDFNPFSALAQFASNAAAFNATAGGGAGGAPGASPSSSLGTTGGGGHAPAFTLQSLAQVGDAASAAAAAEAFLRQQVGAPPPPMPSGHHPQAPPGSEYHGAPFHREFIGAGAQQEPSSASSSSSLKRQRLDEPEPQQPAALNPSERDNAAGSASEQNATGSVANVLMEAVAQAAAAAGR